MSDGFSNAGVLIDILSAPEFNISDAFSRDVMPPATQNGILIFFAIFSIQLADTDLSSTLE